MSLGYDRIHPSPSRAPSPQVVLTDKEKAEEMTRVLTATDPNTPKNMSKYNFRERAYKMDPPRPAENLAVHLEMDGCVMHHDSVEAKEQAAYEQTKMEELEEQLRAAASAAAEAGEDVDNSQEVRQTTPTQRTQR